MPWLGVGLFLFWPPPPPPSTPLPPPSFLFPDVFLFVPLALLMVFARLELEPFFIECIGCIFGCYLCITELTITKLPLLAACLRGHKELVQLLLEEELVRRTSHSSLCPTASCNTEGATRWSVETRIPNENLYQDLLYTVCIHSHLTPIISLLARHGSSLISISKPMDPLWLRPQVKCSIWSVHLAFILSYITF